MIPVPISQIIPYIINDEIDINYKTLVLKELSFINRNANMILRSANLIYKQKTEENEIFDNRPRPGYLNSVLDFKYAESKCHEFVKLEIIAKDNAKEKIA